MGMFDYIRCELPLPVGQGWLYQTKDTQEWCEMKEFVIRSDGRLVKHEYDSEATPEDELPYKDEPPGSFKRLIGCIRKVAGSDREVDQNFDGDLLFYPDVRHKEDETYRATFRGGRCQEICRWTGGKFWDGEGRWARVYQLDGAQ